MRRLAMTCLVLVAIFAVTACGGSKKKSAGKATTITAWGGWSASTHELAAFKRLVAEYDKKHADVNVKVVGDIDDNKIIAPIRTRHVPDVVSTFTSSNAG